MVVVPNYGPFRPRELMGRSRGNEEKSQKNSQDRFKKVYLKF